MFCEAFTLQPDEVFFVMSFFDYLDISLYFVHSFLLICDFGRFIPYFCDDLYRNGAYPVIINMFVLTASIVSENVSMLSNT